MNKVAIMIGLIFFVFVLSLNFIPVSGFSYILEKITENKLNPHYNFSLSDDINFGSAVSEIFFNGEMPQDISETYQERLKELFGWGVMMNTGKMWKMHPFENEYYWDDLDLMLNWFEENGMELKYHTLVWDYPQNPQWYKDLNQEEKRVALEEHVRTIVRRYKGRITMYDVVNEPIHRGDPNNYMGTGWTNVEAITNIFNWAREEDPDAILLINEYHLVVDSETLNDLIYLINSAKSAGALIDGIGMQAHFGFYDTYKLPEDEEIINALDKLSSETNLPIYITEFSIQLPGNPYDSFEEYNNWWEYQAWAYPHAYELFISHPAVENICMWGFYDVWGDSYGLFYKSFEPKPVYYTLLPILTGGESQLKELGEACSSGNECESAYCVDDVCCNALCPKTQVCTTCGAYSYGGIGHCNYVGYTNKDPDNDCTQGSTISDGCSSNYCSGIGYSCGIVGHTPGLNGDGGCPFCGTCSDSDIDCEYHTSGTHDIGCAQCKVCSGSEIGTCSNNAQNTDYGDNLYECIGSSAKCNNGVCEELYPCLSGQHVGDINGDDYVTTTDANLAAYIDLNPPIPSDICCGDVNEDGKIDVTDALMIASYLDNNPWSFC